MEKQTKVCRHCGIEFTKPSKTSAKQWSRRFCCSQNCGNLSKKTPWLEKFKLKEGSKLGAEHRFKPGEAVGAAVFGWKGDKASYYAKHLWMNYHFGKPSECEHCKTNVNRMYHWANISGEYHRKREDWLRLCVPCHKKYDLLKRMDALPDVA